MKNPSDEDWTRLIDFLGGDDVAGEKMKSMNDWAENGNGTNESGFAGLPGGYCDLYGFGNIGEYGGWWSSTEQGTSKAWSRALDFNYDDVFRDDHNKDRGLSLRCLRD